MGGVDTKAETGAALRAVTDAVLGLAGEPSLEPVLERLVHAVRDLVGARYAALGIPDEEGAGFDRFITSGMTDEQIEAIGPLPRTHGLLAAMLTDPEPYRTDDIRADPRFEWWPDAHPRMRSFLGVPLLFKGDIVGAFYLTDKHGGFDDADVELVRGLAATPPSSSRMPGCSRPAGSVRSARSAAAWRGTSMTR